MSEPMDTTKAELITRKHTARVQCLLSQAATYILVRGQEHDASKFDPIELEPLQRMQDVVEREGQAPYGSDEYKRRTAMLGPMLEHHYANNSHHPEHYGARGVNGMCLFDLMEMFFDWKAASERGEESHMSITDACERFNIDDQLAEILMNTAARMDYAFE